MQVERENRSFSDISFNPQLESSIEEKHIASKRTIWSCLNSIIFWLSTNVSEPEWISKKLRHPFVSYVIASLLQVVAVITVVLIVHEFSLPGYLSLLTIVAIVFVALNWGVGPAIIATVIGSIIGSILMSYFVISPYVVWSFHSLNISDSMLFFVVGICVSTVALQTANERQKAREAQATIGSLLKECTRHEVAIKALTVRANEFESVFETMTDGVIIFDSERHVLSANTTARELLARFTKPEDEALSIEEKLKLVVPCDEHGQPLPLEEGSVLRILRGQVLSGIHAPNMLLKVLDGQELLLTLTGTPIHDVEGVVVGAVVIIRDITSLRQFEQRARVGQYAYSECVDEWI